MHTTSKCFISCILILSICVHGFWVVSYLRINHSRHSDLLMFEVMSTRIRSAVGREAVEIAKNWAVGWGGGGEYLKMNSVTPDMTCNCDQIRSSHASHCKYGCVLGCGGVAFHLNLRMFSMNVLPPCSGTHLPFHRVRHASALNVRV